MKEAKVRKDEEGWEPSTPDPLRKEERSLDIGESGQFAPGGYYNQQGVTAPGRSRLDELVPDEISRRASKRRNDLVPESSLEEFAVRVANRDRFDLKRLGFRQQRKPWSAKKADSQSVQIG